MNLRILGSTAKERDENMDNGRPGRLAVFKYQNKMEQTQRKTRKITYTKNKEQPFEGWK